MNRKEREKDRTGSFAVLNGPCQAETAEKGGQESNLSQCERGQFSRKVSNCLRDHLFFRESERVREKKGQKSRRKKKAFVIRNG